jgi:hypothetical protein
MYIANARKLMARRPSIRARSRRKVSISGPTKSRAWMSASSAAVMPQSVDGKVFPPAEAARAGREILEAGTASKMVLFC